MAEKKPTQANVPAFEKAQLLASKRYANRKDLIGALLADDRTYTTDEVDALINDYMKGKVK